MPLIPGFFFKSRQPPSSNILHSLFSLLTDDEGQRAEATPPLNSAISIAFNAVRSDSEAGQEERKGREKKKGAKRERMRVTRVPAREGCLPAR